MGNKSAWLIIAETNLHVGDEGIDNIGVIDQSIQRDAVTNIPCIHSSSLKGAVKEYVSEKWNEEHKEKQVSCKEVFGSEKGKDGDVQKGGAVFFDAELLTLPVQNTDGQYYFKMAYDEKIIEQFVFKATRLDVNIELNMILDKIRESTNVEEGQIFNECNFNNLCGPEKLPIIARNRLNNGESDNLWYEEVLPSKSVLGTFIDTNDNNLVEALDGKIIQIGANATIGYGYCTFVKL